MSEANVLVVLVTAPSADEAAKLARALVEEFRAHALSLPEVVQVFHVTGADDFLLHVAVRDTDALRDFVLDRLAGRPEVGHVETRVVYEHAQRPVLEPLE